MKNLIKITFCLLIASFALTSCGGDDEPVIKTQMLFTFKNTSGDRLSGYIYVFPNRSDYKPETFKETDTKYEVLGITLYRMAQMETTGGETVNSIATELASGAHDEYDDWRSDVNLGVSWLQPCKPGTYYMIAYVFWGWSWNVKLETWQSRIVTIKENNGNAQEFVFKNSDSGYTGMK